MFEDIIDLLGGDEFEEKPVALEEFVVSEQYLGLPPLSQYQYQAIRAMSQVYKEQTLLNLYGKEDGLKRWRQTCNEVILQLGKGCHAPYTPVFNPLNGKWEPLDSFKDDGIVVSSDSKHHYATNSFLEGYGEMVRVKTSLGFFEDVYIGHKYLSYNKKKFYKRARGYKSDFVKISDLNVGDRIGISLGFDVSSPINIPQEHAELIGYWLGDGMLPRDGQELINVDFNINEEYSLSRYLYLSKLIGDTPTVKRHKDKNLVFVRHGKSSNAVRLANEYGLWGMRSKTKRIPDAVLASNNTILAKTISSLWQTDGCVYDKNGLTAEFVSVSENLANDVHKALLRLGIPSYIRNRVPKSNFKNASEAWYVTVTSQESINALSDVITLLDHKAIKKQNKNGRVYNRIQGNIYYDRIISIENIGNGEYWTKTVPDTGNYVGNGMISANSGKDYMSTIAVAYIVYLLLCLKDPQRYYGKPPGDAIDILNIAINAEQAKNVFFKGFKMRLDKCPWFQGRYTTTAQSVTFDKGITCHSGHSEREAYEGYNVLMVILDEISGFATESTSGHDQAKTGSAIYDMYRASVDSRFPDFGKVVLLSFPRYKNDYIQTRYNAVVVDKVVHQRNYTFKIDETIENYNNENEKYNNEFTVDWEEDEIVAYKYPRVFALRRPTWEINPTRKITDFKIQFLTNPIDALSRFACMPPEAVDAFFRSREKIETCFSGPNGVESSGRFADWFVPKEETEYFIHVDLAQKHDHCAVSMAHVDKWVKIDTFNDYDVINPFVIVDAIRWWTPTADKTVDFKDVKNYILELRSRGFRIKLVTFDRWNSFDIMNELKSVGMNSETLSVAKKHYEDMQMLVAEERIYGPHTNLLIDELLQLRIIRDKVDHPRKGSKDLADAVCGSIYNAIVNSSRGTREIEVHNFKDFRPSSHKDIYDEYSKPITKRPDEMPKDVADFLSGMGLI